MAKLTRIDAELVRRGLARSRAEATELIHAGKVLLDKNVVTKPSRQMDPAQAIVITETNRDNYASRGAYKLIGALDYLGDFGPTIKGVRALDAGASTGGFTDVLLRRGAQSVVAVDVGYGQLAWRLREDPRVTVLERTNVRNLQPEMVAPTPQLVVGDLSFISLTLVLPALVECAAPDAEFLLMVKPQFEIGKERLGSGGVVRDLADHVETVAKVADCARSLGLGIQAVAPSPLPGPAGNVEYFLYMKRGAEDALDENLTEAIWDAVRSGPAGSANSATESAETVEEKSISVTRKTTGQVGTTVKEQVR
ncbi:MAG: TlyA family RNA methyltransferase [Actinomycetaceae bacterium]|nr:TlyA family RNA methyltransferase [Actinomycetaceae bacterium]